MSEEYIHFRDLDEMGAEGEEREEKIGGGEIGELRKNWVGLVQAKVRTAFVVSFCGFLQCFQFNLKTHICLNQIAEEVYVSTLLFF